MDLKYTKFLYLSNVLHNNIGEFIANIFQLCTYFKHSNVCIGPVADHLVSTSYIVGIPHKMMRLCLGQEGD